MTRHLVFPAMLAVAACSSGNQAPAPVVKPTPAPTRAAPTTQATAAITLAPGSSRYLVHQNVHIQQDFAGLAPTVDLGYGIYLTATVAPATDTTGSPASFAIDSFTVDSGTQLPSQIDLSAARGLTINGWLTHTGEFINPTPSDTGAAASLGNLLPRFRNFFPRLPPGGLLPAATWTDTTSAADSSGSTTMTTTSINHRAATGWEDVGGIQALRVEITATFEFAGAGEQSGSPFSLKGTGTETAFQLLAADGRYVGGESRDSTTLTIDLPTQGYSIPRRQLSSTRVTALPR
jgi:hypothetical protein